MDDTLGLLEEASHLARELGHDVREEPLGELAGGACLLGGRKTVLVNLALPAADRLKVLLAVLAGDPGAASKPKSRLLARRLAAAAAGEQR